MVKIGNCKAEDLELTVYGDHIGGDVDIYNIDRHIIAYSPTRGWAWDLCTPRRDVKPTRWNIRRVNANGHDVEVELQIRKALGL